VLDCLALVSDGFSPPSLSVRTYRTRQQSALARLTHGFYGPRPRVSRFSRCPGGSAGMLKGRSSLNELERNSGTVPRIPKPRTSEARHGHGCIAYRVLASPRPACLLAFSAPRDDRSRKHLPAALFTEHFRARGEESVAAARVLGEKRPSWNVRLDNGGQRLCTGTFP